MTKKIDLMTKVRYLAQCTGLIVEGFVVGWYEDRNDKLQYYVVRSCDPKTYRTSSCRVNKNQIKTIYAPPNRADGEAL